MPPRRTLALAARSAARARAGAALPRAGRRRQGRPLIGQLPRVGRLQGPAVGRAQPGQGRPIAARCRRSSGRSATRTRRSAASPPPRSASRSPATTAAADRDARARRRSRRRPARTATTSSASRRRRRSTPSRRSAAAAARRRRGGSTYVNIGAMTAEVDGGDALKRADAGDRGEDVPGTGRRDDDRLARRRGRRPRGQLTREQGDRVPRRRHAQRDHGRRRHVSCKVSMLLATYPDKSMFGFLKGGAQVEGGGRRPTSSSPRKTASPPSSRI